MGFHTAGQDRGAFIGSQRTICCQTWRRCERARASALLHHLLEDLPVLQRVHGPEEVVMLVRHELIRFDQPAERFRDEFFPLAHVVKDFGAQHEIAGIYPDI